MVQFFPWEQFYLYFFLVLFSFVKNLSHFLCFSAHVTICSSFKINWSSKLESLFNKIRTHVEFFHFCDCVCNLPVSHIHFGSAVSVYIQSNRLSNTYCVRYLHQ